MHSFTLSGIAILGMWLPATLLLAEPPVAQREFLQPIDAEGNVTSTLLLTDQKTIAVGKKDGTVELRDAATGQSIMKSLSRRGKPHTDKQIFQMIQSNCGDHLFVMDHGGTINQWHIHSGEFVRPFSVGNDYFMNMCITKDGGTLIAGTGNGRIFIWDVSGARPTQNLNAYDFVRELLLHPRGERVYFVTSIQRCFPLDLRRGYVAECNLTTFKIKFFRKTHNWDSTIEFSLDGKSLIVDAKSATPTEYRIDR